MFAATEKMKGLWMPIAAFKADNVAKGVVDASLQEGFAANMFKGVYKAQVETAVSKAIFDNEKRLREQGAAMHATLRQVPRDQIIWGFKILYKPLQDKEGKNQQPRVVTKDMAKSLFDKVCRGMGDTRRHLRAQHDTHTLMLSPPPPRASYVFTVQGRRQQQGTGDLLPLLRRARARQAGRAPCRRGQGQEGQEGEEEGRRGGGGRGRRRGEQAVRRGEERRGVGMLDGKSGLVCIVYLFIRLGVSVCVLGVRRMGCA